MSIIFYGAGSTLIVDFEECCWRNNLDIKAIVSNFSPNTCFAVDQEKLIELTDLTHHHKQYCFVVPLFTPKHRFFASQQALSLGLKPFGLLSFPNNAISITLKNGAGCFINAGVTIAACCTFGNFVLINRGVSIGHHANFEDYVSIGPGATICSNVHIETGAVVGAGATVLPKIRIGRNAKVGAGCVVTKDVPEAQVVVGNPARFLRNVESSEML